MTTRAVGKATNTYSVNVRVQMTSETPRISHSWDGNGNRTYRQTSSGTGMQFTSDGENQLVEVETDTISSPIVYRSKSVFTYDGLWRLRKRVDFGWGAGDWSVLSETRYLYDGMQIVQERDGQNRPVVTYTRGRDLSGTVGGAGGIGGLLARSVHASTAPYAVTPSSLYHADGVGNVTYLADPSNGAAQAAYRYDPFGRLVSSSGTLAGANAMRFSSKPTMAANVMQLPDGLSYYGYRFYDPSGARWINRDPIEETGGINLYNYANNNPVSLTDPLGLLVTAVLDTKNNTLTVTDDDTKKRVTVQAFTGGHVNPDCSIVSPGTGKEISAPGGAYNIVDNPNPRPGTEDWYGLFKQDSRMDDYFDDNGKERSGVRLHLGGISHGCVTVSRCQPDAAKKWMEIRDMINSTKKEKLKFREGPHWWNGTGETSKYGTITIK